jgi:hypothetical protein
MWALNFCHVLTKPEGNEQIMEIPARTTGFSENCTEKNLSGVYQSFHMRMAIELVSETLYFLEH